MTNRMMAIREVFGAPDVFTVRPSTFGEIDPIAQEAADMAEQVKGEASR